MDFDDIFGGNEGGDAAGAGNEDVDDLFMFSGQE